MLGGYAASRVLDNIEIRRPHGVVGSLEEMPEGKQAICDERFSAFTHPAPLGRVEARMRAILDGTDPVGPVGVPL